MQDVLAQILRRLADLERRVPQLIRIGSVAEVLPEPYRVIVNLGTEEAPVLTGPLEVLVPRSGPSMVDFSPLDPGEGVLVLAPGGSARVMYVLPSLVRGRGKLIAGPADTRYIYGSIVATGKVKADAQIALGHDVPGAGVSLATHLHPSAVPPAPTGPPVSGT